MNKVQMGLVSGAFMNLAVGIVLSGVFAPFLQLKLPYHHLILSSAGCFFGSVCGILRIIPKEA